VVAKHQQQTDQKKRVTAPAMATTMTVKTKQFGSPAFVLIWTVLVRKGVAHSLAAVLMRLFFVVTMPPMWLTLATADASTLCSSGPHSCLFVASKSNTGQQESLQRWNRTRNRSVPSRKLGTCVNHLRLLATFEQATAAASAIRQGNNSKVMSASALE